MARVTIEDSIQNIANRFELVMVAAQRARALASGDDALVAKDNDKNPVVALREIAEGKVDVVEIKDLLVRKLQSVPVNDESAEELNFSDINLADHIRDELELVGDAVFEGLSETSAEEE